MNQLNSGFEITSVLTQVMYVQVHCWGRKLKIWKPVQVVIARYYQVLILFIFGTYIRCDHSSGKLC